jgi:hypothetical protein
MNVVNEYEVEIDVVVHVPVRKRVVIPASLDDGTLLVQEGHPSLGGAVRLSAAGTQYLLGMQDDDWAELMSEVVHIDTQIIERVPF